MENTNIDFVHLNNVQISATVCFVLAVLHTFLAKSVSELRHRFPENSPSHNFLHYLGEVEVVFGFWAMIFLVITSFTVGIEPSVKYLDGVGYGEPLFVFCIMCTASTKPVLDVARACIAKLSRALSGATRLHLNLCEFVAILSLGPILGSFITEPAAMTVCALLIKDFLDVRGVPEKFKYAVIGLLFVNVSIGGVFTTFAAPPVLMVAAKFGWDNAHMITHFGWKAGLSIVLSSLGTAYVFRKSIVLKPLRAPGKDLSSPLWIAIVHIGFMALMVAYHQHIPFFMGLFLLFLGWVDVTQNYQSKPRLREALLVGFFLAGLVTLGNMQGWWLSLVITRLDDRALFLGATALTAVTDNAALTYLGSLVPNMTESARYFLVAGAVAGGGLTVIANAPNPAGYGILRESFGEDGVSPLRLFLGALPHTLLIVFLFGVF